MKYLAYIIAFLACLLLFTSCEKAILGEEVQNSPEEKFELLWTDFNEHYALFEVRSLDWDSIYTTYRPLVSDLTTDVELWDIFTEMLDYLDDSHIFLFDRAANKLEISGYELNKTAHEVYRANNFRDNYLENFKAWDENGFFESAKIKDKEIGYIYIGAMDDFDETKIDDIIENQKDLDAIIVDIRSNKGGDGNIARYIADRFADGVHFTNTTEDKIGPARNDFSEKTEWFTAKRGPIQFTKPVVVISNRATISAGEDFLLAMNTFAHVTHIGDTTAGDFSNTSMHRFLPNGWEYRYSTQLTLLPDGSHIDGIGHIPAISVKNDMEDVLAGKDIVLDRAMQFLFEEYGIN